MIESSRKEAAHGECNRDESSPQEQIEISLDPKQNEQLAFVLPVDAEKLLALLEIKAKGEFGNEARAEDGKSVEGYGGEAANLAGPATIPL